jgi:hypothetical protein
MQKLRIRLKSHNEITDLFPREQILNQIIHLSKPTFFSLQYLITIFCSPSVIFFIVHNEDNDNDDNINNYKSNNASLENVNDSNKNKRMYF